jgi:hypothetical protein
LRPRLSWSSGCLAGDLIRSTWYGGQRGAMLPDKIGSCDHRDPLAGGLLRLAARRRDPSELRSGIVAIEGWQ